MQSLPHISSTSQIWKIRRQKGVILSRSTFWVLSALCYLEKCSFCPIPPLKVVWFENSWKELHFSRLLDPPMPEPQTLNPQYLDLRPPYLDPGPQTPHTWTLDPQYLDLGPHLVPGHSPSTWTPEPQTWTLDPSGTWTLDPSDRQTTHTSNRAPLRGAKKIISYLITPSFHKCSGLSYKTELRVYS